jgi:hypothetical protein
MGAILASGDALGQDASSASRPGQARPQEVPPGHPAGNPLMRYRFGVNYVNTRDWHLFWNGFDADQVARDLDSIAAMDMDHMRVLTLWPYFQPWYNWVDPTCLRHLDQFMELAQQRNLDICLSMLNGWFLGNARPFFYEVAQRERFYACAEILTSEKLLFAQTAKVLKGHRNFLGFDIGNEMNVCWSTHEKTVDGDAWMEKILAYLDAICPAQVHVNGVDHQPWFSRDTFSPPALARLQRMVPLHCYIKFTGALDHGKALDPPGVKLIAGMAALARAYANDPAKPIWAQEFGMSPEWIDPKMIPRFIDETVHAAMDEGVSWFTWYSSHDTTRKFDGLGLDYELGLMTRDYRMKDQARVYQALARQYHGKAVVAKPGKPLAAPPTERSPRSTWKWLLDWMGR